MRPLANSGGAWEREKERLFMGETTKLGKPVSASRAVMSVVMMPYDANPYGSIHGGVILKNIDQAAGIAALRHCRCNVVTAAIDSMSFLAPSLVGELVTFKASVNHVGSCSFEVGVRVESEDMMTGNVRHSATAYLTFVALDANRRPTLATPLLLETDEDRRRNAEAVERRKMRTRTCSS